MKNADGTPIVEVLGIWLNKRAIATLEMPFRHSMSARGDGWKLDALEAGKLLAKFIHGATQGYDLEKGDYLLSSGEDLYLALHRRGEDDGGKPTGKGSSREQRQKGG